MRARSILILMLAPSAFAAKPRSNAGPGDDVIPVIILGGEWSTTVFFNNTNDLPVLFPLAFYNKDGPWSLHVKGIGEFSLKSILLQPRATLKVEFDYSSGETTVGFAKISVPCDFGPGTYCAGVGVTAMLRNHNSARKQDFEVSYQLASTLTGSPQQFMFDQSNFGQMVLNLTNYCVESFCDAEQVTIEIFDESGNRFFTDAEDVAPSEVKIINFAELSSQTWNKVGMIRLSGASDIAVTGHRINETGSFTPLYSYDYNF